MSKVTSKLQVTLPKGLADEYGIHPGDQIEWEASGAMIRVIPGGTPSSRLDLGERLRVFEAATKRIRERSRKKSCAASPSDRGWRREDLYGRTGAR